MVEAVPSDVWAGRVVTVAVVIVDGAGDDKCEG